MKIAQQHYEEIEKQYEEAEYYPDIDFPEAEHLGEGDAPTLGRFSIYRFSDGSVLELGKSHLNWEPLDSSWLLDQLKKEITAPMSEQLENELRDALANCMALRS